MDDVECTAGLGGDRPNILFTPPCACPRCAPAPAEQGPGADTASILWLPVDGRPVRHVVAPMHLGTTGKAVLG